MGTSDGNGWYWSLMRCAEFREHHCAYVDDTLAGVELVRMQGHVAECENCAERDARVRRSLMLARSIPHIEPSADFARKLEAKLRECRMEGDETARANFGAVAVIGVVASLLMLGYVTESLLRERPRVARDIVLAPVIAMADRPLESEQPEIVGLKGVPAPEIIASVSAGMPIWPAALLAEQGALHFANYQKTVH